MPDKAFDDVKKIEEQTHMADFITGKVFALTQDNNLAIHVSIAGGRKTMAFYLEDMGVQPFSMIPTPLIRCSI
ncbi:CRISPR-associated ring nuclease [Psychromonas sp.]|uniref:CRISPR-associated ring nuclease n=1 Tax=Psychromonas sp. TaxID=1884585 RepID=UPI0035657589